MATRRFASVCCFAWKAAWPCRLFQSDSHKKCCRYLWHCWLFLGFCARASGSAACASGAATLAEIAAAIALCMLAGRPALPRFSSIVCAAAMLTGGPSSRSFKQPRIIFLVLQQQYCFQMFLSTLAKMIAFLQSASWPCCLWQQRGSRSCSSPARQSLCSSRCKMQQGFASAAASIYRYHVSPKQPRV